MKSGRTGTIEGNGQRTVRGRKKMAIGERERTQDQTRSSDDLRALIAAGAYSLYAQRGYEDGHDLKDWLEAEHRILTENH